MGAAADRAVPDQEFAERLWVPWWWWVLAVLVVAVLGAELHAGFPLPVVVGVYVVVGALVAVLLLRWGGRLVRVHDGVLSATGRTLPVAEVRDVRVLAGTDARRVLAAHPGTAEVVLVRGYAKRLVYVAAGPEDDLRFWLLSSRRAAELAAALGHRPDDTRPDDTRPDDTRPDAGHDGAGDGAVR